MSFDPKFTIDTIALVVTGLATIALAIGALIQLPLIGRQVKELSDQIDLATKSEKAAELRAREWHTIEICQRYDFDMVIDAASLRIFEASNGGVDYHLVSKRDVACILNYLDGIAVGIRQGFYIEAIVKAHMVDIFDHAVKKFIEPGIANRDHFQNLTLVHAAWSHQEPPAPGYQRSEF